jgi:hypothetical protein
MLWPCRPFSWKTAIGLWKQNAVDSRRITYSGDAREGQRGQLAPVMMIVLNASVSSRSNANFSFLNFLTCLSLPRRAGNLPDSSFTYVPKTRTTRPVVILTNDNSASASEVLTGALKGNGRATVVGMRTFGKGVVQYYFPMGDGSGLRLTVFKYLTPDGVDISREGGLIPDIQCNSSPNGVLPTRTSPLMGEIVKGCITSECQSCFPFSYA